MNQDQPTDDHDPPNALPRGTLLNDKFRVQRVIGVGGFGIVYLAHDEMSDVDIAIKEYMPASLAGRTKTMHVSLTSQSNAETFALGLKSFWNEARLLAKFRDEHLPLLKVYDAFQANGTAYMVMPVLRGRTAYQLRRDMPNPPTERWLRALLTDLLPALERLHAENVFHRDISPDNIQVDINGKPVLMDLGAARHVISNRTQSITAILKPGYAPIEQYGESERLRQGPWTDIYALGATLHFLLLNKSPAAATARIFDPGTPLVGHELPGCSPAFLRVIDWMLEPKPEGRPQNVEQLRTALFDSDDATVVMAPKRLPPMPKRTVEAAPPQPAKPPPEAPTPAAMAPTLAVARPPAVATVMAEGAAPSPVRSTPAAPRPAPPTPPPPPAASPAAVGRSPMPIVMAGVAVLVVAGAAAWLWPRQDSTGAAGARADSASQPEVPVATPAALPRNEPVPAPAAPLPTPTLPAQAQTTAPEPIPAPPPVVAQPSPAPPAPLTAHEAPTHPTSSLSNPPSSAAALAAKRAAPPAPAPAASAATVANKKAAPVNDKDGALLPRPNEPAPQTAAAPAPPPAPAPSPAPAPPPPAPAAASTSTVASPAERCSDKSGIGRRLCIAVVCGLPELHSHPECAAIRRN